MQFQPAMCTQLLVASNQMLNLQSRQTLTLGLSTCCHDTVLWQLYVCPGAQTSWHEGASEHGYILLRLFNDADTTAEVTLWCAEGSWIIYMDIGSRRSWPIPRNCASIYLETEENHDKTSVRTAAIGTGYLTDTDIERYIYTNRLCRGREGTVPCIPDLGTRWEVSSFTFRPLLPQGKEPQIRLKRRTSGHW
jgi:hypothetical protein